MSDYWPADHVPIPGHGSCLQLDLILPYIITLTHAAKRNKIEKMEADKTV